MPKMENTPAVGWGIEVSPDSVSPVIRERYTQMVADAPEWNVQLVDFYSDNRYAQTDICTVFWRSESVKSGVFFERDTTQHSKIDPVSAVQSIRTISGQNVLRAGRLAGLKGQSAWPSDKCVESSCKDDVLDSGSPAGIRFGDLGTVRAMNDGQRRLVVGFDSEFCYRSDGSRVILSYQFCWCDPCRATCLKLLFVPWNNSVLVVILLCLSARSWVGGLDTRMGFVTPMSWEHPRCTRVVFVITM